MEMLNSQKRAVLSSSPVLFEMAGLAYLDLCILYIHFFECQEHKRNTCCININTNILILEPAQAAKEHSASAGSILTHCFVNSGSKPKPKPALCRLLFSGWFPPEVTLLQQCPKPIPRVGDTHPTAVCDLADWAESWSAAEQHHSSISASPPHGMATLLSWRAVKKPGKARWFVICQWSLSPAKQTALEIIKNRSLPLVQKNYSCYYFWIWDWNSDTITAKQATDTAVSPSDQVFTYFSNYHICSTNPMYSQNVFPLPSSVPGFSGRSISSGYVQSNQWNTISKKCPALPQPYKTLTEKKSALQSTRARISAIQPLCFPFIAHHHHHQTTRWRLRPCRACIGHKYLINIIVWVRTGRFLLLPPTQQWQ